MKNYSDADHNFIDGVWSKVRYLEYVKTEQEKVKRNSRRIAASRVKLASILAVAVIMISVPLLLINGLDLGTALGGAILLLGAGALFEYYCEKENDRRATHGNKNREPQ